MIRSLLGGRGFCFSSCQCSPLSRTLPFMGIRTLSALSCSLVLLLCASPIPSSAQTAPHAFTLEQVLSSPFPSNLVAAENSGRIAWVFTARGERNVWIADAPNFEARQVT